MSDLRDALGEPIPADEVVTETPEPEAAQAEPEVAEPEEKPAKTPDQQTVPLAALQEERQKRQELERRIQRVESTQPKPEPTPAPDVFDDPEGYTKHVRQSVDQTVRTARLDMSEDMARMHYGDETVDAALAAIEPRAGSPEHQAILNNRNPYRALVEWHRSQVAAAEIGDPAAWKEAERARIKAEVEAELAVRQTRGKPAPSLADQPNLGARRGPEWSGPKPLDELFNR